jgi:hypothetical protein
LEFGSDLTRLAKFDVVPLSVDAEFVDAAPASSGTLVVCGSDGIHLVQRDGAVQKIAAGKYVEARATDDGKAILAIGQDGSITRFDR